MNSYASVITAAVCVYLIMGLAGCATPPSGQLLKDAVESRRAQQCEQPDGDVIIIITEDL